VGFPINAPIIPMHYNPKPEIRFGASKEDLFLTINRLEEIHGFVITEVFPQFLQFFDPVVADRDDGRKR
jgi:hypothetical protein